MTDTPTPTPQRATTPDGLVAQLTTLLTVEKLDTDLYRGSRQPGGKGRVFGGQVIAQALQAAQGSVDAPRVAHSLHAYFMRAGSEDLPIIFRVERDFEGRSFATRRVIALQDGKPILNMAASFQTPEDGMDHQAAMPDVPMPEDLPNERDLRASIIDRIPEAARHFFLRARAIELRPTEPHTWICDEPCEPVQHVWFRVVAPLPDEPALHRAMLAYASDMVLLGTSMRPHAASGWTAAIQSASLDHALWLHEPFRVDDWLLYTMDSPWSGHGRGFNRGRIYTQGGRLVASVSQEGMIRKRRTAYPA